MTEKMMKQWRKELREAVLTMDVEEFRAFYHKWQRIGIYDNPLPRSNEVLEVALRELMAAMLDVPEEKRAEAIAWLKARGYYEGTWCGEKGECNESL